MNKLYLPVDILRLFTKKEIEKAKKDFVAGQFKIWGDAVSSDIIIIYYDDPSIDDCIRKQLEINQWAQDSTELKRLKASLSNIKTSLTDL